MININLVMKSPPLLKWRRVGMVAGVAACIMVFAAYGVSWWSQYQSYAQQKNSVAKIQADAKKATDRSKAIQSQEDQLKKQENAIAGIGRNQAPHGQSVVFASLLGATPPGVALTKVAIDKSENVTISGTAGSFALYKQFMQALQALPKLTGVTEQNLTTNAQGQTTFTVAAIVRQEGAS